MYITEFDLDDKTVRIEQIAKRVRVRIKNRGSHLRPSGFSLTRPQMEVLLQKVREIMDEVDQTQNVSK